MKNHKKLKKLKTPKKLKTLKKPEKSQKIETSNLGKFDTKHLESKLQTLAIELIDSNHSTRALVDSGASGNFISEKLVRDLQIPIHKKQTPTTITTADISL